MIKLNMLLTTGFRAGCNTGGLVFYHDKKSLQAGLKTTTEP